MRKATVPAQMGLRVMRVATWAATITLSALYLRRVCYLMADTSINAMDRCFLLALTPHVLPCHCVDSTKFVTDTSGWDREQHGLYGVIWH